MGAHDTRGYRGNRGHGSGVLGSVEGDTVDEVELREFLRERYPRLVGAVALVTGDAASAEDAVQEAIVRAWERTERGEQIVALDRWVAAVALNLSRSRLRRLRVERLARPKLLAAPPVQPSGDRVDIARALAELPRRQREVAVLRYVLDLGTEEIAKQMGTRGHGEEPAVQGARASGGCAFAR